MQPEPMTSLEDAESRTNTKEGRKNTMTQFEKGKRYRLLTGYTSTVPEIFTVLARTESTVTLKDHTLNQVIKRRIDKKASERYGYEIINPCGKFSCNPQLWANTPYND